MSSLNKAQIIGRLGNEPEVRYMPNGEAVANLSVATSERWKDKQGQPQEKTEWHRITMYRRQAEVAGDYLKKGSLVYIEGRLETRKWQDNNGQDRYTTEIIADRMKMLEGRQDGQAAPKQNGSQPAQNMQQNMTEPEFDQEIPFAPIGLQYRQLLNAI